MSAMEDSNSGDETYNREGDGNESPKSESQSRSSSPARSESPASPRSPSSPCEQDAPENPESPASPSSSHSSPSSPVEQKSSPQSPASPRSPSSNNGQQSEHEASDVEMSDAEEAENEEKDNDENAEKSGDERSHSEAEDSDREENIPEVNIDSGDEVDNKSEQNASDNEGGQSGDEDEKDEQRSVHVDSDADNKSDDEQAGNKSDDDNDGNKSDDENEQNNENSSPKLSSSPVQTEKDAKDSDDEEIKRPKKANSDADDNVDSDSDAESEESEVGGLIADIFGESDEEGEFEGFNEEDIAAGKTGKEDIKPKTEKRKRATILSDSEDEKDEEKDKEENDEEKGVIEDVPAPPDDEDAELPEESQTKKKKAESIDSDDDVKMREDFVSDFDLMMQKKKEESSKRRKRRDVDLISDSDDLIADIIAQMRMAAEEDKQLNKMKKTATKKLKILPMVLSQLKKQDLKMAFLDQGVLNVIAEWLTPLPDRSLPHLNIREGMFKQLSDYPNFDPSLLKSSGIGRALMYLYKHPKETKENRERAGKLITEWARPIFNVTTNYHALTKEEREQRDYDHIPKRRKMKDQGTSEADEVDGERKDIDQEMTGETTAIRPGDKGWIGRARVPMPSTKDYVNRPKWNVEMEFGRGPSKKPLTRIEKHMRSLQDKKRQSKQQRAITISIEGRKMAI